MIDYDRKYSVSELQLMNPIDVYKLVLNGKYLRKFPNGFWLRPEALNNAKECTKYLLEDILKLSKEDILNCNQKTFKDNGLGGMLINLFDGSPYKVINNAYPDLYHPWEFKMSPMGYWNKDTGLFAAKWLFDKLSINEYNFLDKFSSKLFGENGLSGMVRYSFGGNTYNAVNAVFPGKFKPWQINLTPNGYWNKADNIAEAVRWMLEEILSFNESEIKEHLSCQLFEDHGLGGMLATSPLLKGSPYKAIDITYPNRFKPWDFTQVPRNYWTEETGREAMLWLIDKYNMTREDILRNFDWDFFIKNNLQGMLRYCFDGSIYKAVDSIYKSEFEQWEFKQTSKNYWSADTAKDAILWMLEKENISQENIPSIVTCKLFEEYGLGGMLSIMFNSSPFRAIDHVFPDRFKPWEYNMTTMNYWNIDTARDALLFIIDKYGVCKNNVRDILTSKFFKEHKLAGLITQVFDGRYSDVMLFTESLLSDI